MKALSQITFGEWISLYEEDVTLNSVLGIGKSFTSDGWAAARIEQN